MKQAGRPIGKQIRQICEWLEKNGPAFAGEVQRGTGILPQSVSSTCMRAVCFGFIGCDEHKKRKRFWVIDGWQQRVTSNDRPKLPRFPGEMRDKERLASPVVMPRVNSVWSLGA